MAYSLTPFSEILGIRKAKHLLRRTTYNYSKETLNNVANMTATEVVGFLSEDSTDDNQSCVIYGCTEDWAINYDTLATFNDGSCMTLNCDSIDFDHETNIISMTIFITPDGANSLLSLGNGQIGVFFDHISGNQKCGGSALFSGEQFQLIAYEDDPLTFENDGFNVGDTIFWKFQDEHGNAFNLIVDNNQHTFVSNGMIFISSFEFEEISCENENIYGCTYDEAINYDFEAILDDGSCLFNQFNFYEEYIPLYLPQGWGMFGYTCLTPMNVEEAFLEVISLIQIVKDNDGNPYLPEYNFNGLGDLIYSRGYQIKTIEEITEFSFCPTIIMD